MNKDEIKKALGQCSDNCIGCPYKEEKRPCRYALKHDARNLITEQEKEIERLKAENKVWSTQINQAYDNGYKDGYDSAEDEMATKIQEATNGAYNACQKQFDKAVNQAKIDVLTELKRQAEHCDQWNCEVIPKEYIDDMIKEQLKK